MPGSKERKYVERRGMMGYLKKHATDKDPDSGLPVEVFVPVSNFTFDIVDKITGDHAGFVVEITCHPDQIKAKRYIPIGSNREQFCHHANKTLGDPDWGGLTTSIPEPAFKQKMVTKQLDFEKGDRLSCKRGTTTVGKVEGQDMWIFNNEVHLQGHEDERGETVISELGPRDQKYILLPSAQGMWSATVTTPLTLEPMKRAVQLMRSAFQHNFIPAMYVLGHACMSMHAEIVASRFDSCPVTIAVGPSGLGKTMSLKMGLGMNGIGDSGYIRQFKREAMISLASRTTLGCFLDDPQSLESRKESAIDFYGMGAFYTLSRGLEAARCGFLMTANYPLQHHEERDLRRMIYVPFAGPKISDSGGHKERVELKMMRDEHRLSACMKSLVLIGLQFRNEGWEEVLQFQERWAKELPGMLKDTLLNYGILIWFTEKVSATFGIPTHDIRRFWKEHIVPYVVQHMQEPTQAEDGPSVLDRVRAQLISWIVEADIEDLAVKVKRRQVNYTKQGNDWPVDSLLVMNEALKEAVSGIPVSTIRGHLKATREGLSETKPYKVQGTCKRFTVFKLQSFTQQQQATILNSLEAGHAGTRTDSNVAEKEDSRPVVAEAAKAKRRQSSTGDNPKKKKKKKKKTSVVHFS